MGKYNCKQDKVLILATKLTQVLDDENNNKVEIQDFNIMI